MIFVGIKLSKAHHNLWFSGLGSMGKRIPDGPELLVAYDKRKFDWINIDLLYFYVNI